MKYLFTFFMAVVAITINAQSLERQVIGTAGGTFVGNSLLVTSTVGESVVKTFTTGTVLLTQGYQQAESNSTTIEEVEVTANYKLFPNPTVGNATLELVTKNTDADVSIIIYTVDGKLIYSKSLTLYSDIKSSVQIDLSNQANGVYYINILDSKSELSEVIQLLKQ